MTLSLLRRRWIRGFLPALLLVGLLVANGCKEVIHDDDRHPDRGFHDDHHDDHFDHY